MTPPVSASMVLDGACVDGADRDGEVTEFWRLCAAKRLAPDRESQTMGLREAFFLNRLNGNSQNGKGSGQSFGSDQSRFGAGPVANRRLRARATSPLRNGFPGSSPNNDSPVSEVDQQPPGSAGPPMARPRGSVYVVKLIAVKEDWDDAGRRNSHTTENVGSHSRSVSDAITTPTRHRSSTVFADSHTSNNPDVGDRARERGDAIRVQATGQESGPGPGTLTSFPSLPSLNGSKTESPPLPSLSRLVLLLEHAPLGTMDRLLRTSPGLVGRQLWERWAREGVEALVWVHGNGVVHADVKPGNLLVSSSL